MESCGQVSEAQSLVPDGMSWTTHLLATLWPAPAPPRPPSPFMRLPSWWLASAPPRTPAWPICKCAWDYQPLSNLGVTFHLRHPSCRTMRHTACTREEVKLMTFLSTNGLLYYNRIHLVLHHLDYTNGCAAACTIDGDTIGA